MNMESSEGKFAASSLRPTVSLGGVVGIATAYGLDARGVGVRVLVMSRNFSTPRRPDPHWGPHNLISKGYQGSFLGSKAAGA